VCTACQATVDYTKEMVLDQMIKGLADEEIQKKVLAKPEAECTLAALELFIMCEESCKLSLADTKSISSVTALSAYKKQQKTCGQGDGGAGEGVEGGGGGQEKCSNCGWGTHGSSKEERKKSCPAFSELCNKCQQRGHFSRYCRSKKKPKDPTKEKLEKGQVNEVEDVVISALQTGLLFGMGALVSKTPALLRQIQTH
jgi:hypothetical protein